MDLKHSLPVPKITIGTQIAPFRVNSYERKRIVRYMISDYVKLLIGMRKHGYCERTRDDSHILSKHVKAAMLEVMRIMDTAYAVEIAGVLAGGHHLGLRSVNQCYVNGDSSWSGMDFYAQLLFRAKRKGNHVCFLVPSDLKIFSENYVLRLQSL